MEHSHSPEDNSRSGHKGIPTTSTHRSRKFIPVFKRANPMPCVQFCDVLVFWGGWQDLSPRPFHMSDDDPCRLSPTAYPHTHNNLPAGHLQLRRDSAACCDDVGPTWRGILCYVSSEYNIIASTSNFSSSPFIIILPVDTCTTSTVEETSK
jgi:hypothetical protein